MTPLDRDSSLLVVVDVQRKLAPAIADRAEVVHRISALVDGAARLGVPILATEQSPEKIGTTIHPLADRLELGRAEVLPKRFFDATREDAIAAAVRAADRPTAVVCGMETHVFVLQTAAGLRRMGIAAHVAADACGSRRADDRATALDRLRAEGVPVVSVEMVLFEWLERAETAEFDDLLPMIRALDPARRG